MSIVAALDKVLFFNASSKYSVLRMKTEDSSVPTEARSLYRYHDHLIRFTAVGIELPQTDTVKIEMDGEWKDGKYGLQLQVDHWKEIVPPTLEGVRNYLASGLLKGIGEKTADAIIEKFGINALEILEHQPDRLLEIRGITKERLAEIKDTYAETSRMRVLMTLLAPFKVTPTTAQKIYQHFGPACADIVRQSPFNLCQVPGFGFKRIDAIVQKSGGDLRDPKRVHGALFYALEDARTKDGHLYLEAEALLKAATPGWVSPTTPSCGHGDGFPRHGTPRTSESLPAGSSSPRRCHCGGYAVMCAMRPHGYTPTAPRPPGGGR